MSTRSDQNSSDPGDSAPVAGMRRLRDRDPLRIRCGADDGSPEHLALTVEAPVAIDALTLLPKRCGCGAAMVFVFGERG